MCRNLSHLLLPSSLVCESGCCWKLLAGVVTCVDWLVYLPPHPVPCRSASSCRQDALLLFVSPGKKEEAAPVVFTEHLVPPLKDSLSSQRHKLRTWDCFTFCTLCCRHNEHANYHPALSSSLIQTGSRSLILWTPDWTVSFLCWLDPLVFVINSSLKHNPLDLQIFLLPFSLFCSPSPL